MTAGTGAFHSEFNPSDQEAVHLYQIWILPERKGLKPGYEEMASSSDEMRDHGGWSSRPTVPMARWPFTKTLACTWPR